MYIKLYKARKKLLKNWEIRYENSGKIGLYLFVHSVHK